MHCTLYAVDDYTIKDIPYVKGTQKMSKKYMGPINFAKQINQLLFKATLTGSRYS